MDDHRSHLAETDTALEAMVDNCRAEARNVVDMLKRKRVHADSRRLINQKGEEEIRRACKMVKTEMKALKECFTDCLEKSVETVHKKLMMETNVELHYLEAKGKELSKCSSNYKYTRSLISLIIEQNYTAGLFHCQTTIKEVLFNCHYYFINKVSSVAFQWVKQRQ